MPIFLVSYQGILTIRILETIPPGPTECYLICVNSIRFFPPHAHLPVNRIAEFFTAGGFKNCNRRPAPHRDIRPIRHDLPHKSPRRYRPPTRQRRKIVSHFRNSCSRSLSSLHDLKDGPLIIRITPVSIVIILMIRFFAPFGAIYTSVIRPIISLECSTRFISSTLSLYLPLPGIFRAWKYVSASPHLD